MFWDVRFDQSLPEVTNEEWQKKMGFHPLEITRIRIHGNVPLQRLTKRINEMLQLSTSLLIFEIYKPTYTQLYDFKEGLALNQSIKELICHSYDPKDNQVINSMRSLTSLTLLDCDLNGMQVKTLTSLVIKKCVNVPFSIFENLSERLEIIETEIPFPFYKLIPSLTHLKLDMPMDNHLDVLQWISTLSLSTLYLVIGKIDLEIGKIGLEIGKIGLEIGQIEIDTLLLSCIKPTLRECCFIGWNPEMDILSITPYLLPLKSYDFIPIERIRNREITYAEVESVDTIVGIVNQALLCCLIELYPIEQLRLQMVSLLPRLFPILAIKLSTLKRLIIELRSSRIINLPYSVWKEVDESISHSQISFLSFQGLHIQYMSLSSYPIDELWTYPMSSKTCLELSRNQSIRRLVIQKVPLHSSITHLGSALQTSNVTSLTLPDNVFSYDDFFPRLSLNTTLKQLFLSQRILFQDEFNLLMDCLCENFSLVELHCRIDDSVTTERLTRMVKVNETLERLEIECNEQSGVIEEDVLLFSSSIYLLYQNPLSLDLVFLGRPSNETWIQTNEYQLRMETVTAFRTTQEYKELIKEVQFQRRKPYLALLDYKNQESEEQIHPIDWLRWAPTDLLKAIVKFTGTKTIRKRNIKTTKKYKKIKTIKKRNTKRK